MRAGPGPSAAPGLNLETFCEERIPASAQSNARRSRVRGRWSVRYEMRLWPGLKRCWEDRRWLLVMLSGLQQPDDRSSQSVGSSSYSADSGYTGGESVLWWLVQTGADKMVRGQPGADRQHCCDPEWGCLWPLVSPDTWSLQGFYMSSSNITVTSVRGGATRYL